MTGPVSSSSFFLLLEAGAWRRTHTQHLLHQGTYPTNIFNQCMLTVCIFCSRCLSVCLSISPPLSLTHTHARIHTLSLFLSLTHTRTHTQYLFHQGTHPTNIFHQCMLTVCIFCLWCLSASEHTSHVLSLLCNSLVLCNCMSSLVAVCGKPMAATTMTTKERFI